MLPADPKNNFDTMFNNGIVVKYNPTNQYFKIDLELTYRHNIVVFVMVDSASEATVFKSDKRKMGIPGREQIFDVGKQRMNDLSFFLHERKISRDMITIEEVLPA